MRALRDLVGFLFPGSRRKAAPRDEPDDLRAAFRARYHDFKLLLTAHSEFLESMAAVEAALQSRTPFGIELVRTLGVTAATGVFRMIRLFRAIAPGRYAALETRFREIKEQLGPVLSPRAPDSGAEPLAVDLADLDRRRSGLAGFPAVALGEVAARMPGVVPPGFVVTAAGFRAFMAHQGLQEEIDRRIQAAGATRPDELAALSQGLRDLIENAPLPLELENAIALACSRLTGKAPGTRLALRGEAVVEAAAGAALVGHDRAMLNVDPALAARAYRELAARKYGPLAMAARRVRGLRNRDVSMVVSFQAMAGARAGGVLHTRSPRPGEDMKMLLAAALGLPDSVTEGTSDADSYLVSRTEPQSILVRVVRHKAGKFVCDPKGGVCRMQTLDGESDSPALTDEAILSLGRLARDVEELLGAAVELEWLLDEAGTFHIVHCRHLSLPRKAGTLANLAADECRVLVQGAVSAAPGLASGPAHIVVSAEGLLDFPDGGVIVASSADPRLAALLPLASAVVSESGTATSRLAGICREWGIPALVGAAGALSALTDGQPITVDADHGRVLAGIPEGCAVNSEISTRSPLLGSPVHEALIWAADLIIPLNLMEVETAEFRPENCRTLHDIARFIHERSVEEMFAFCQSQDYAQAKSRRLVCQVPMQFWVVNLDDGYWKEEPGDTVRLSNIASLPMLALWKGMMAVPWGGPPGVNPRGFLSVVFEATRNPELDPVAGSSYTVKNYFMVSRNFCSLQSRFGFHFCSVEALVGERALENYAVFRFEGGAANSERRMRRIHFIAGILKEFGFDSEIVADRLAARIKGLPQPAMEEKLSVLGYLITHTRQLDMVMTDMASVKALRAKMVNDLSRLFPPEGA